MTDTNKHFYLLIITLFVIQLDRCLRIYLNIETARKLMTLTYISQSDYFADLTSAQSVIRSSRYYYMTLSHLSWYIFQRINTKALRSFITLTSVC